MYLHKLQSTRINSRCEKADSVLRTNFNTCLDLVRHPQRLISNLSLDLRTLNPIPAQSASYLSFTDTFMFPTR